MARHKFFIAGSEAGVGKTLIASAILVAARDKGWSTVAMKPVATGCRQTVSGTRSDDALLLQELMSVSMPYEQVNPVALEPSAAPHIAAGLLGKRLLVSQLVGFCRGILMQSVDLAVIEGSGGWRELLNVRETLAGVPKELRLPVIFVIAINRNCVNHAMLTVEAIARDGVSLAGWVANDLSGDTIAHQEIVATLKSLIHAPCLGDIPFLTSPTAEEAAIHLELGHVINK
ncbi:MAG: dethiobiotin synthetase [Oceanicoccus sp.]|jgi:dethiobiotin synthetase